MERAFLGLAFLFFSLVSESKDSAFICSLFFLGKHKDSNDIGVLLFFLLEYPIQVIDKYLPSL